MPPIDWCKYSRGREKISRNFAAKIMMLTVKARMPEIFKPCPIGPLTMDKVNITFDKNLISVLPNGVYRLECEWIGRNHSKMFEYSDVMELF